MVTPESIYPKDFGRLRRLEPYVEVRLTRLIGRGKAHQAAALLNQATRSDNSPLAARLGTGISIGNDAPSVAASVIQLGLLRLANRTFSNAQELINATIELGVSLHRVWRLSVAPPLEQHCDAIGEDLLDFIATEPIQKLVGQFPRLYWAMSWGQLCAVLADRVLAMELSADRMLRGLERHAQAGSARAAVAWSLIPPTQRFVTTSLFGSDEEAFAHVREVWVRCLGAPSVDSIAGLAPYERAFVQLGRHLGPRRDLISD
jgi:hypothetical protein